MVNDYSFGIYKYTDKETGLIDYIGLDSHIDINKRHNDHLKPSNYNKQPFNRILQNNPNRWEYSVWYHVSTIEEANQLEYDLINLYRPRFNYRHGGGVNTLIHDDFEYTICKASNAGFMIYSKNHTPLISCRDESKLLPIVDALNNQTLTESDVNTAYNIDYILSYLDGELEEIPNTFVYTVVKSGKNGFCIQGTNHKPVKSCNDYDKLQIIADALNDGRFIEDDVKGVRSTNKLLESLWGD